MRRGCGVPSQLRTEPAVLVSTIQVEDGAGLLQTRLSSHTHPAGPWLERKSARDCGRRKVGSQVQLPGYLEVGKGRGASVTQAARAGWEGVKASGAGPRESRSPSQLSVVGPRLLRGSEAGRGLRFFVQVFRENGILVPRWRGAG